MKKTARILGLRFKIQDLRMVLMGLSACLILFVLVSWLLGSTPENVRPANVFARSFSVGWVSKRAGDGCVVAFPLWWKNSGYGTQTSTVPYLPKVACATGKGTAHLVEFLGMKPETTYGLMVFDGVRFQVTRMPRVTTLAIKEESPTAPKPAYGTVFDREDENRVGEALVYVYSQTNQTQYPVAVLSNEQGNYALDLANLMRGGDSFVLEAWGSVSRAVRIETDVRRSTPFPPLWIERTQDL